MSRKMTLEEVRVLLQTYDCTLLSTIYGGNTDPLDFICSCGEEETYNLAHMRRQVHKAGYISCRHCSYDRVADLNGRPSFEMVKTEFEKRGFTLLETSYKAAHTPMKCVCSCGRETTKTYVQLRNGVQCKICGLKKQVESNPRVLTFAEIVKEFTDRGFTVLDTEYKNAHGQYHVICPCGREAWMRLNAIRRDCRCKACSTERISQTQRHTLEFVRLYFASRGCVLLAAEYQSAHQLLKYICECGEEAEINFNNFSNNKRCGQCRGKKSWETRRQNEAGLENADFDFLADQLERRIKFGNPTEAS